MNRRRIGRYEIVGELGRGAMGAVYRAHDPVMGRTVALKCILSAALSGDQTQEYRQRFFREARAAGALAHPGIVPVFDAGEDDGIPFLVMEFVQGQTLADSLKHGSRYSLDQVCEIGQHIAEALGFAHRNGIVHRDIKPANILMTSREIYGAERPRITDFGVAKLAGGEMTTTGQLLGTPAFMPPEQFTGAPIDGRTDLFSVGVILYRMACGEQPFSGETLTAVSYKIVHTEPIPPSRLNPAVTPSVEALLLRCLAKNPAERFQTGEELAAALAAVRFAGQTLPHPNAYSANATGYRSEATVAVARATAPPSFAPAAPPPYPGQGSGHTSIRPQQTGNHGLPVQTGGPAAGAASALPAGPQASPPPVSTPLPASAAPARQSLASQPTTTAGQADPGRAPSLSPEIPPSAPRTPRTATSSTYSAGALRTSPPSAGTAPRPAAELPPRKSPLALNSAAKEPPKKRGFSLVVWVLIAVAAVFVMRYLLQDRVQQSLEDAATGASRARASASAAPTLGTSTAQTEFNPNGLDPSRSGRLRLALDGLPSSLPVSLEVDGRPYWSGTVESENNYSGFLIPTGRHQLRIVVSGGAANIPSNSVSADFTAGKRALLSAQARPRPAPGAAVLDRGARITLTVHPDAISF